MKLPERINHKWMETLDDASLLTAEARLHKAFATAEASQRRVMGEQYDLMQGPAELLAAWDRWSRVHTETRVRKLHPRRTRKA